MAPFVKNETDDPQECPPLGIPATPAGHVVEVDELAARALEDHPIWKPDAGPATPPPAEQQQPDGATSVDGAGLTDSVTVTHATDTTPAGPPATDASDTEAAQ